MIEVLTKDDKDKWDWYLGKLPLPFQDVFYTSDYYALAEESGYGKATCFVLYLEENIAFYPFLINKIEIINDEDKKIEYFDIQGAYGYNGILSNTTSKLFINEFIESFSDFCKIEKIVVEFSRFNPILQNNLNPFHLEPVYDQNNIILNLRNVNIEINEYEYSTRKNIKKAIRSGLESITFSGNEIPQEYLNHFCNIYYNTMNRNKANSFYYFSTDYFMNLIKHLPNASRFFFVSYSSKIISAELVLLSKSNAYSFLGGTLKEYFDLRPNDFLKDRIIKYLIRDGKAVFCLGGGPEGVTKYKKTFSKNGESKFFYGKKIHDQSMYQKIIELWKNENPISAKIYSDRVLKYRFCDKSTAI